MAVGQTESRERYFVRLEVLAKAIATEAENLQICTKALSMLVPIKAQRVSSTEETGKPTEYEPSWVLRMEELLVDARQRLNSVRTAIEDITAELPSETPVPQRR